MSTAPSPRIPPKRRSIGERLAIPSFVLGIIGLLVGVAGYVVSVRSVGTSLTYWYAETVLTEVPYPTADLSISYRGQDLVSGQLSLRSVSVSIFNSGDRDITQDMYDQAEPFGFRIPGAEIVQIVGLEAPGYLFRTLNPQIVGGDHIEMNKAILDHAAGGVTLNVLVLLDRHLAVSIIPIGKIAGVRDPVVEHFPMSKEQSPLPERALAGDWPVQILRFSLYGGIALFGLGACLLAATWVGRATGRSRKNHQRPSTHPYPRGLTRR